jgi:hypothetical protein
VLQLWDYFACQWHFCFPFAHDGDFGTSRLKGRCAHNILLARVRKGGVTVRHGSWRAGDADRETVAGISGPADPELSRETVSKLCAITKKLYASSPAPVENHPLATPPTDTKSP